MRFVFAISRLATNGPSFSRIRLAQALRKRGHDVTILTFSPKADIEIPDGVHVESVDRPTDRHPRSYFGRLRLAMSLRRWFKKETARRPIDFFSSSLSGTDRIVAGAGIQNAQYWIHIATSQLLSDARSTRQRHRRLRMFRHLYHDQQIIGVSQGVIDDMAALGVTPRTSRRLYNGYDVDVIRTKASEDPSDLPRERFMLYAGRFAGPKRLDVLFDAVSQIQTDVVLALLTESSQDLLELIERHQLKDRVRVLGFRDNPYPHMKAAELLVLSSDREGFPNVLVEALICGTPVISTNCSSGPSEILTAEYSQWLSPTGDAEALATNIRRALSGDYEIAPWLYERFTLDAAVNELESISASAPRPKLGSFSLSI